MHASDGRRAVGPVSVAAASGPRSLSPGFDRRKFLARVGAGGVVAWSAPVVTSVGIKPAFATPAPACPSGPASADWDRGGTIDGARELYWVGAGSVLLPELWLTYAREQLNDYAQEGNYIGAVRAFAGTPDYFLVVQLGTTEPAGVVTMDLVAAPPPGPGGGAVLALVQRTVGVVTDEKTAVRVTTSSELLPEDRTELVAAPTIATAGTECQESCDTAGVVQAMASVAFCAVAGVAGCSHPFSFLTCAAGISACTVFTGASLEAKNEYCERCNDTVEFVSQCL